MTQFLIEKTIPLVTAQKAQICAASFSLILCFKTNCLIFFYSIVPAFKEVTSQNLTLSLTFIVL